MRIGIFGGTFDPVHNEHINLCRAAAGELKLSRLIVLPAGDPPHKALLSASAEARLEMTRAAFSALPIAEVSDFEIVREGTGYTYLTLAHFAEKFPDAELFFIVGSDSMADIQDKWARPDLIARYCKLAVAGREGYPSAEAAAERFGRTFNTEVRRLGYSGADVSSTEARVLLEFGFYEYADIPDSVRAYIEKKGLYRKYGALILRAQQLMSEKRWVHTAFTTAKAVELARRIGVSEEKAFVAAALHDVAKKVPDEELERLGFVPPEGVPPPVIHAYSGAYLAEREFGITDPEILAAITFHTTARPEMSGLEKVLYVADCIEKTRDYEGVDELRLAVESDFERGFITCLKATAQLLADADKAEVSELTAEAYRYYAEKPEE